jgi:hypothetical protein
MKQYILMADVIHSGQKKGHELMRDFKKISNSINLKLKNAFLSPITITLGDEFQSIVKSLVDGIEVIIKFEELIIKSNLTFKLRYVLNYGEIETPINPQKAHGMLGQGLTDSRKMLELEKQKEKRFLIKTDNKKLTEQLNMAFNIYQSFIDNWKFKDFKIVSTFLEYNDYKKVAKVLQKDQSSVWRRKKSLKMDEYTVAVNLIHSLIK